MGPVGASSPWASATQWVSRFTRPPVSFGRTTTIATTWATTSRPSIGTFSRTAGGGERRRGQSDLEGELWALGQWRLVEVGGGWGRLWAWAGSAAVFSPPR